MSPNYAAQRDAIISLSVAYEGARDFTRAVLRAAFGEPPPPPVECVWPPAGVTRAEVQSRLDCVERFLGQTEGVFRKVLHDIKAAQVGLVASGFEVPRLWIITDPLDKFTGGCLGVCGLAEIVQSAGAEDAVLERVLGEISVDLVLLKGKIAGAVSCTESADSPGTTGDLIERLLAGPDDAELTRSEAALLSAYLDNYQLPLSAVQQEKNATGESATLAPPAPDQVTGSADSTPPAAKTEQGQGNGGAGSTPPQSRESVLRELGPAARKAYLAFQYAETMNERRLADPEAYAWLKENGIDSDKGDVGELGDYQLPAFDTWSRQLRLARNPLGEQKYTRRAGRKHGQSIAKGNQIEYQEADEK